MEFSYKPLTSVFLTAGFKRWVLFPIKIIICKSAYQSHTFHSQIHQMFQLCDRRWNLILSFSFLLQFPDHQIPVRKPHCQSVVLGKSQMPFFSLEGPFLKDDKVPISYLIIHLTYLIDPFIYFHVLLITVHKCLVVVHQIAISISIQKSSSLNVVSGNSLILYIYSHQLLFNTW